MAHLERFELSLKDLERLCAIHYTIGANNWCVRRDSNSHSFRNKYLTLTRLPGFATHAHFHI